MAKIMNMLEAETGGKSYKAHKYSLDTNDRPSIDYGEDTKTVIWKKIAETIPHKKSVDLSSLSKKISSNPDQILSYFLDGSRRVFKVDDMAYLHSGKRSIIYPVVAGQIGVAACRRIDRKVSVEKFKHEVVIALPDIANADGKSGFFPATAKKLNESSELKRIGLQFSTILSYKTAQIEGKKYEDRGTACIQDRMIEREKELVAELVREGKLGQDNYLIKDGSLEYKPTKDDKADKKKYQTFKKNYDWVLGVSKSFNPEVCLDVNGKPNPGSIADLDLYHRTPVSCFENPNFLGDIQFAVWYIRIRRQSQTRTPFDGILKVEKMLVRDDEINKGVESSLIDLISARLINERNPACYGSDLRWANHIYPVYLTETFVKSRYLSNESFLQLF